MTVADVRALAPLVGMLALSFTVAFARGPVSVELDSPLTLLERQQLFVRRIVLDDNTVFSDGELAAVTEPFENRVLAYEDLEELRHRLTLFYVERGYISSGALIRDQAVRDGVVHIAIIEGGLTGLEIGGYERLREGYLRARLDPAMEGPLNVERLRDKLLMLQQDPLVRRVNAELLPGLKPGESVLRLEVEEAKPYRVGMAVANDRPPSVGAERARVLASHSNLTGLGDRVDLRYGISEGADDVAVAYALPLTARDTTLLLALERSDASVIEEPFADLDIDSELRAYSAGLSHPLYRTPRHRFSVEVTLDRRHSETFLGGESTSFIGGLLEPDGESDVTSLRFTQEWLDRTLNQAIAARSTFSVGIDILGASDGDGSRPDAESFSWLGQFQWARRFGQRDYQVIFRSDLQLAADALLPLEQFAAGGAATVRGYRENQLVRDNAWVTSLELRVPVLRLPVPGLSRGPADGMVQLAPFADHARGWNTGRDTPDPRTISSVGLGLRWDPGPGVHAQLYWGLPLREIDAAEHDLQDSGVHFRLEAFYP